MIRMIIEFVEDKRRWRKQVVGVGTRPKGEKVKLKKWMMKIPTRNEIGQGVHVALP